MTWQFMDSGASPGFFNMLLDESLALKLLAGKGNPTLRVFRWKPWAISLGFHQDIGEIEQARCAADGIDVVRRPTGGRAILHAEELTYSVVMTAAGRSVSQIYNDISRGLLRGLQLFGVAASFQRSHLNPDRGYKHASSIPCFSSSARYEIEWRGKKLVGSAQRRYVQGAQSVILQHGSILCGPAHLRLTEYLRMIDQTLRDDIRRELEENTVDLSRIVGTIAFDDLASCIRKGFELEWGLAFSALPLIPVLDEAFDD